MLRRVAPGRLLFSNNLLKPRRVSVGGAAPLYRPTAAGCQRFLSTTTATVQKEEWTHRHGIPAGSRVVAVGDVHGDSGAFERLLLAGGVIDKAGGPWSGGDTTLVQVGDILDRGVGEVTALLRMQQLSTEAEAAGGRVIGLMGNHELMNYTQDFRFVTDMFSWGDGWLPFEDHVGPTLDAEVEGWRERYGLDKIPRAEQARHAALRADIPIIHDCIKPLRQTSQIAAIVGDTLFVHGGLAFPHLAAAMALKTTRAKAATIAETVKAKVNANSSTNSSTSTSSNSTVDDDNTSLTPEYTADEALAEINSQSLAWLSGATGVGRPPPQWLSSAHGPCWNRFYSQPYDPRTQLIIDGMLREVLRALECTRMVVGHTPQDKINCMSIPAKDGEATDAASASAAEHTCDVWRIDTGISAGISAGVTEVLEITDTGEVSVLAEEGIRIPAVDRINIESSYN